MNLACMFMYLFVSEIVLVENYNFVLIVTRRKFLYVKLLSLRCIPFNYQSYRLTFYLFNKILVLSFANFYLSCSSSTIDTHFLLLPSNIFFIHYILTFNDYYYFLVITYLFDPIYTSEFLHWVKLSMKITLRNL